MNEPPIGELARVDHAGVTGEHWLTGDSFNVPLISHIEGNLYQGGCFDGAWLPDTIEYVVSLYPWERYGMEAERTRRVEFVLYDSDEAIDADSIDLISRIALDFARRGPTLVHCQAGLNRSGLVLANALILEGRTPAEAIALLRRQRSPAVLCNPHFERWLLGRIRT